MTRKRPIRGKGPPAASKARAASALEEKPSPAAMRQPRRGPADTAFAMLEALHGLLLDDAYDIEYILARALEILVASTRAAGGAIFVGSRAATVLRLRTSLHVSKSF